MLQYNALVFYQRRKTTALAHTSCPPTIKECKKLFDKVYSLKGGYNQDVQDDEDNTDTLPLSASTQIFLKSYIWLQRHMLITRLAW